MKKIITISREFGSGGRTIGKQLAEELGIPCYDSEIIEKVAIESGFAEEYIKDKGEYTHPSLLMSLFTNRSIYTGPTNEDKIWLIQCRVIKELAEKGPCVIVGRCADYVLKERNDTVNIFIHANMDYRKKRAVEVRGVDKARAEQVINKTDKVRANYYSFYSGQKWGFAQNYDLCIDSSKMSIDQAVSLIIEYLNIKNQ